MIASILLIYWFQPETPIRHLDFWLPTACLGLVILAWSLTRTNNSSNLLINLKAGFVIIAVIIAIGLTRYFGPICCLTPSRPPAILQIIFVILAFSLLLFLAYRFASGRIGWLLAVIVLIILLFIVLKSEPLAALLSLGLRSLNHQSASLASSTDIKWLGFSYVSFRLLQTLRDRINMKLPELTLMEYVIYIIFFPAYIAGPIDRVQRFVQDLHQPFQMTSETILLSGKRILLGVFSKYVIADSLSLFALNNTNSNQVNSSGWLWIMLYAFSLRIFFDFSGYTDIALGLGQLLGIKLPENFDRPYLKQNLTLFWNSWHITLAQWFRAYFYNPLTRGLRSSRYHVPVPLIIFIGQLSTFTLIGLWHGISWNFAIWGVWHGIGLFIHNRWSNLIRSKISFLESRPHLEQVVRITSTIITFHYVCLGWVWFALSTPALSWNAFLKLFRWA